MIEFDTCIVAVLRSADLSVLGSINAYKSVVSLLLGTLLLGEIPTLMGGIGILLIVSGSDFIVDKASGSPQAAGLAGFFKSPGIRLRFAALILSAMEASFLKKAVLLSSPVVTFSSGAFWGFPWLLWCCFSWPKSTPGEK